MALNTLALSSADRFSSTALISTSLAADIALAALPRGVPLEAPAPMCTECTLGDVRRARGNVRDLIDDGETMF